MRRVLVFLVACGGADRPRDTIDPPALAGAMAPQLHAHGDALLATWLEPVAARHRLQFARWERAAWSRPVTIAEDVKLLANWADTPSIGAASDGALVVSWAERSGDAPYAYDAVVARSTDGGATWTRLGRLHRDGTQTEHGFVAFAPEPGGVRAIWLDGRAMATEKDAPTALRTAVIGEAIGEEAVIDERVCDCCGTALARAPDRTIAVYRDRSADEIRDIGIAIGSETWSAPALVHADGWNIGGCPVNGPAIAADGDAVAIAWFTSADSTPRVRAVVSHDGGASFGAPIELDAPRGGRTPIGRVGVAYAGGAPVVTWMVVHGEAADIVMRRIARDGPGPETVVARTKPSRDAGFPRVAAIGPKIFVAWTEPTKPPKLRITVQ